MVGAAVWDSSFGESLQLVSLTGAGLFESSADALATSLGKAAFRSSYPALLILKPGQNQHHSTAC